MNQNIENAIENLRTTNRHYSKYERYYSGVHELSFATDKFVNAFGSQFREFAMNLCPAVCDAVKDKLKITGFAVEHPGGNASVNERANATEDTVSYIARIWDANRMGLRSGEIHKEALKNGDAYVIVWPDANGRPAIFPNSAANIAVSYDEEMPGRIESAAKFWRTADKRTRLNLYFADRVEKYITAKESEGTLPEASEFVPFAQSSSFSLSPTHDADTAEGSVLDNPFGVVPIFHFANNADIGCPAAPSLRTRSRSRTA